MDYWVAKKNPGYKGELGPTVELNGRQYDSFALHARGRKQKRVYFDVTKPYGKSGIRRKRRPRTRK